MIVVLRILGMCLLGLGLMASLGMFLGPSQSTVFAETASISAIGFGGLLLAAASALGRLDGIAAALRARDSST
ncbi:MAG: hypothetical protein O9320_08690 [Magnetospirillum sp.]|nr:hypothetical protein [Magnetospirillum sp.]